MTQYIRLTLSFELKFSFSQTTGNLHVMSQLLLYGMAHMHVKLTENLSN